MYDFSQYHAIVTGGTRGIGKAIVKRFLAAGAKVVATYAGNETAAEELRGETAGLPLELYRFDVADYAQAEEFFRAYDRNHDSLAVLVNNAGIRKDNIVGMMPHEDWDRVVGINLTGSFNMSKLAVQRMMGKRFGRIICITSPSGRFGFEGQANYAAAKAGQVALARSLSKEVGKRKITVNCVSPGFIDTELIADLPEELRRQYLKDVPLRRFGTPDEVASAVMFLSGGEASYITGATLEVTGGL